MDGRPPGNTGCCRLFFLSFFFFCLPSPLAPAPHPRKPHLPLAPRTPARSERSPAFQPLPGWVAGAPTPAADLGCLRAAREPLRIRLPGNQRTGEGGGGGGALSLGLPWQASGTSGRGPGPSPRRSRSPRPVPSPTPRRILAGNRWVSRRRARTTLTHTHTKQSRTHTPRPTAAEKGQEPETTGKGDGERGRERDRQQEDHTDFQTPGRHTLSPPFWVSPGPQSTGPHRRPPTLTHTLSRTHPLAWGRGLGFAVGGQAEGDL